jgi:Fe-S-cluster containining protein
VELPEPPPELVRQYRQLLADLENAMAAAGTGAALHCRPGCASCCISFAVLPIEAAILQAAIAGRPHPSPPSPPAENLCPLLVGDLCSVYAARPVICRTQGLALAYVDEERETIAVSACSRNFADDFLFQPERLLFMDAFNDRLSSLNMEYCRLQGTAPDRRIPIRELAWPPSL